MFEAPERKSHTLTFRRSFGTGFGIVFGGMTAFAMWWVAFAITLLVLAQEAPHILAIMKASKGMY